MRTGPWVDIYTSISSEIKPDPDTRQNYVVPFLIDTFSTHRAGQCDLQITQLCNVDTQLSCAEATGITASIFNLLNH